jgi:hypothetical protein
MALEKNTSEDGGSISFETLLPTYEVIILWLIPEGHNIWNFIINFQTWKQ